MKPLLRTLLAVNAVVVLLAGLLFVVTPWLAVFEPLAGLASSPALVGQLLGVVLLGFAWLQAYASTHGAVTAPVARISGHTMWVAALVLLVWVVAIRTPALGGPQQLVGPIIGVILLILGLAQARLGGAVHSRERREAVGAASALRAERRAQVAAAEAHATGADPYFGMPASSAAAAAAPGASPAFASVTSPAAPGAHDPEFDSKKDAEAVRRRDVPPPF